MDVKRLRRSSRHSTEDPIVTAKSWIRRKNDQSGLSRRFINEQIGMGVFVDKESDGFKKGQFIVTYHGELIEDISVAQDREKLYTKECKGSYMYYFSHAGKEMCIDATVPDGSLGRLVNHDRKGNCVMKKVMVDKEPFLCLFAATDVSGGTELRYDYGISNLPWEIKDYMPPPSPAYSLQTISSSVTELDKGKGGDATKQIFASGEQLPLLLERIEESDEESDGQIEVLIGCLQKHQLHYDTQIEQHSDVDGGNECEIPNEMEVIMEEEVDVNFDGTDITNDSGINGDFPSIVDTDASDLSYNNEGNVIAEEIDLFGYDSEDSIGNESTTPKSKMMGNESNDSEDSAGSIYEPSNKELSSDGSSSSDGDLSDDDCSMIECNESIGQHVFKGNGSEVVDDANQVEKFGDDDMETDEHGEAATAQDLEITAEVEVAQEEHKSNY